MKFKGKNVSKKSGRFSSSIVFYIAGIVTALLGIALLVNNIILFRKTLNQYVAQGYSASVVLQQLIPSQLLPGIFEPIGVYGGIAVILMGIGIVNRKFSKYLTKVYECSDNAEDNTEESILDQNVIEVGDVEALQNEETSQQSETIEKINEEISVEDNEKINKD
ncbi:hypothetical protein ACJDU8_18000 [Clostridium sp. WILCCON 0269]|uniref:Uncharacterized protein n=1 Tax=Candidatus Clostridium eludens TaxID=3381663 RepID=A0ABW8SNR1_9CLOT